MVDVTDPRRGLHADPGDGSGPEPVPGFFSEASRRPPEEVVDVLVEHVAREGDLEVAVWLVDVQQTSLLPFGPGAGGPLSIVGTLAGRAYQDGTVVVSGTEDPAAPGGAAVTDGGDRAVAGTHSWFPLRRGAERLGVACVRSAEPLHAEVSDRLADLFVAFTHVWTATAVVSDTLVLARRTRRMDLAAEIQGALLPPLSWSDRRVTLSATLEPSYDVAGDAVDYNVAGTRASLAIFDGMGHGLESARTTSLTVSAYRNLRRAGLPLAALASELEGVVAGALSEQAAFTTALLAELDLDSGRLAIVNAGHDDPLLFRDARFAGSLAGGERQQPLGLARPAGEEPRELVAHEVVLQPGDAVLLHTDGLVEARDEHGEEYGPARLRDRVSAHLASGLAGQEIVRRISGAVLEHHGGRLEDDATLLLLQWHGPDSGEPVVGEEPGRVEPSHP